MNLLTVILLKLDKKKIRVITIVHLNQSLKMVNDRLPLLSLANHLTDYPTPKNLNYWWTFGGILTFCLITQIVTDIGNALYCSCRFSF